MRRVPADREPVVDGAVAYLPLTKGQIAVIDAADIDLVAGRCWYAQWVPKAAIFYAARNGAKDVAIGEPRVVFLHRWLFDVTDSTLRVDHIDHNTLDNRRANLRVCSHRDNLRNRRRSHAASGYMGVYPNRSFRSWAARVQIDGVAHRIGTYSTAQRAAIERDAWIRDNCPSEFWTFNFPLLPGERGIDQRQGVPA